VPITFTIINNDSDPDGVVDPSTVDLDPSTPGEDKTLTVPGEGTYEVDDEGNVTFTPEAGFTGETTPVPYTVKDDNGLVSNPANITVTVEEGANNPPVADVQEVVVPEGQQDTPLNVTLPTDLDGDPLSVTITEVPTVGTITKPDGTPVQPGDVLTPEELTQLLYDAPAEDPGTDPGDLTYTVSDGIDTVPGSVNIVINDAPNALDNSVATDPGQPVTFSITDNDSDPDGVVDPLTVDLDPSTPEEDKTLTVPGEGTYEVDDEGNVTFTPEAGFAGETTPVPYTVKDDDGLVSNPANITVNV
jgi:CshA-type fibril repeat protein